MHIEVVEDEDSCHDNILFFVRSHQLIFIGRYAIYDSLFQSYERLGIISINI